MTKHSNAQSFARTPGSTRILKEIKNWGTDTFGPAKTQISEMKFAVGLVADLLGHLAKIASLSSLFGAALILIYLIGCDAPLPPIQLSDIPVFAVPITGLTAFFILYLSFVIGIPLVIRRSNAEYMRVGSGARKKFPAYLWRYWPWLGTTLALLALLTWASLTQSQTAGPQSWILLLPIALYLGTFAALKLSRRTDIRLPFLLADIYKSLFLFFPWGITYYLMVIITLRGTAGTPEWLYLSAGGALTLLQAVVLWQRDKLAPPWLPFVGIPLLVFVAFPYSWGGTALRILGMGGETPISVLLRPQPYSNPTALVRRVSGCLVVATSSDLFLRSDTPLRHCQLKNQYQEWVVRDKLPTGAYHEVTRYSRADILTISEYPRIFWINARLRGELGLTEFPGNPNFIRYWKEHGFKKVRSVTQLDLADEYAKNPPDGKVVDGNLDGKASDLVKNEEVAQKASRKALESEGKKAGDLHLSYAQLKTTFFSRGVPSPNDETSFNAEVCEIERALESGDNVLIEGNRVHGRASFVAVGVLVAKGRPPDSAIADITALIGNPAIATDEQRAFLDRMPRCSSSQANAENSEHSVSANNVPAQGKKSGASQAKAITKRKSGSGRKAQLRPRPWSQLR